MKRSKLFYVGIFLLLLFANNIAVAQDSPADQVQEADLQKKIYPPSKPSSIDQLYFGNAGRPRGIADVPQESPAASQKHGTGTYEKLIAPNNPGGLDQLYYGNAGHLPRTVASHRNSVASHRNSGDQFGKHAFVQLLAMFANFVGLCLLIAFYDAKDRKRFAKRNVASAPNLA